jgi:hypothetical protein
MTALDIARISATFTRKDDIMVAPTRMGYRVTTRKLRPSRKLPLMATTADMSDRHSKQHELHCKGANIKLLQVLVWGVKGSKYHSLICIGVCNSDPDKTIIRHQLRVEVPA